MLLFDLQKPLLVTLLFHVLHRRKLCSRLWIVGPHLVRFEVCRFVCPIKEHSVPAGRNWSNLYYPNTCFWRFSSSYTARPWGVAFHLAKDWRSWVKFLLDHAGTSRKTFTNLKLEFFEKSLFLPRIELWSLKLEKVLMNTSKHGSTWVKSRLKSIKISQMQFPGREPGALA